jgi:hypothetical protein
MVAMGHVASNDVHASLHQLHQDLVLADGKKYDPAG